MKRTELRRLAGALLALVMVLGMVPGAVKQANAENGTTVPAPGQDETEIQPIVNNENPVDHIELVSPAAMTLIENMGGGWYTRWDPETESYVPYFDYYLDAASIQIAIHYKDGTVKTASPYDEVDGCWVEYIDTQNQNPWKIGKSNIATISYRDRKTTIPVVIEEHPVDYMELVSPTPVTLIGGVDIDWVYTSNEETGQSQIAYFYYGLKYAGVQVAIHFKNGAVQTASIGDEVDGYGVYDTSWDAQYESLWEVGKTYTGTISYMDRELSVPVSIIFPYYPITGICGDDLTWSMTDDGLLTISGTGAMWDRLDILHNNMFDRANTAEITEGVTAIGNAFARLKNLTSVTFTGAAPSFADDAFTGVAATVYYPANDPTWTEDVRRYYGGVLTWVAYNAEPEPVTLTGIVVAAAPAKTTYEIGEELDTAGLTLTATYSDSSTATITEGFTISGFDSAAAGEKTVTITYEGKTVSFTVTVSEETAVISYTPGDINGDGKVNNKDLTRLFQYLSDWDVEVVEAALDVNGDKKVNNKDLTRLFQYLSDWDVEIF